MEERTVIPNERPERKREPALEDLIPSDHRSNKTAWINYCLILREELLKQRAKEGILRRSKMAAKEKELKVLSALSQLTEPARPSKIGEIVGKKPIDVGRYLTELLKRA